MRLVRNFDGSVTKMIEALTGEKVNVEIVYEGEYEGGKTLSNLQIG